MKELMKEEENLDYDIGRVTGPWVFDLYSCPTRIRFHVVQDRRRIILPALIPENVLLCARHAEPYLQVAWRALRLNVPKAFSPLCSKTSIRTKMQK